MGEWWRGPAVRRGRAGRENFRGWILGVRPGREWGKEERSLGSHQSFRKGRDSTLQLCSVPISTLTPANPAMTKQYQDLQHLDNEENDHQLGGGERTSSPISERHRVALAPSPQLLVLSVSPDAITGSSPLTGTQYLNHLF